MTHLLITITGFLLFLPAQSFAQDVRTDECFGAIYAEMAHEERLYRSIIYGQKKSADLPIGNVRYDSIFETWMKTGVSEWRSLANGHEDETWDDAFMDSVADVPPRRGILETRMAPTSDLIPALLQSTRALQCNLRTICLRASLSRGADPSTELELNAEGCLPQRKIPLKECAENPTVLNLSTDDCSQAVTAIMEREARLLQLAVTYDAAYRSLLQFAGNFEGFLLDFRFPILQPIWQAVRAIGSLDRLPCFLSQCDE